MREASAIDDLPRDEPVLGLRTMFLWLNSGCNARCVMCDIWKDKSGSHLTAADIAAWSKEWASIHVRSVVLCGEALLHPELWTICDILRERGLRLELLSNGFLVSQRAADIVSHCDELRVSLDGPAHVHNVTRGVSRAFELLDRGIQSVRRIDPDYGIWARCAINHHNYQSLPETVATAKELGLSGISFSATDIYNEEAFKRYGHIDRAYTSEFMIGPDELDDLQSELNRFYDTCAGDFESGYIANSIEEMQRNVYEYYRGLLDLGPLPVPYCNKPWTSVVIEHDGTVRPCFPLDAYGNLHLSTSLLEVLNLPSAHALRAGVDVRTNPKCLHCVCATGAPRA